MSCLGAGGGDGEGGGGEVEKLAQQLATLEVRLESGFKTLCYELDGGHGLPAYSHHDKIPPWWEYVCNDKGGNVSLSKSHHT